MNLEEFYYAIEPLFQKLKHPVLEFEFNENTNEHISVEPYIVDNIEYTIVVRKDGLVVYGIVDGAKFNEVGTLGKLKF